MLFPRILLLFQFEMIHVRSEEFEKTLPQTYALYAKYQTLIHNDPPNAEQEYLDFLQRSPLKVADKLEFILLLFIKFYIDLWLFLYFI